MDTMYNLVLIHTDYEHHHSTYLLRNLFECHPFYFQWLIYSCDNIPQWEVSSLVYVSIHSVKSFPEGIFAPLAKRGADPFSRD